jgi:hypothetical protein
VTSLRPGEEDGDVAPLFSALGAVLVSVLFTDVSTFVSPVLVHFL